MGYSKYPEIYKSYIVTVPQLSLEKVRNPELWPEGVYVSNFLYNLAKKKEVS